MYPTETRRPFIARPLLYGGGPQILSAMILYAQRTATILRTLNLWTLVASLAVTWQESCENPPLFCYRIGRRIFTRDAA